MTLGLETPSPSRGSVPASTATPSPLDLRTRLTIRLAGVVLRVLGWTWRVTVHGRETLLSRRPTDPRVVLALWHGQMLPLLWAHRQPTGVMISEHRDGEIIARVVGMFGFFGVRGSTSRGGARALLECVQVLRAGADIAITPDGPRGPRHNFAPGALIVAFRARVMIVPLVAHVSRSWRLRSWDAFEIPKPFARVTIVYGAPRQVEGTDVRDVSERVGEFAEAMQGETARAQRLSEQR